MCRHLSLVAKVARQYVGTHGDLDDLAQTGTIGLIKAVTTYDPDRGTPFAAYARPHIAGEIRHALRRRPLSGVPRWLATVHRELMGAVAELEQRLGRSPTTAEIAARMNIAEEGVLEILRAYSAAQVEPDGDLHGGAGSPRIERALIRHQRYVTFQLPIEDRLLLLEALERLEAVQRKVIYYLFYMDLTQSEAAKRLRISQRHVSRLMTTALTRLREALPPSRRPVSDRTPDGENGEEVLRAPR